MGKYTKRSDGRYQASINIGGKRKFLYANSEKELDKKVTEYKFLSYKGTSIIDDDILLNKFADKWLEINSVGKEEATIKEYKYIINSYIKPNLGYKKIKNIKVYDIQEALNNLSEHPRVAKKFLTYIRKILNEAVQNDIIIKNPASLIKSPKYTPAERKPLTDLEDKLLIECSKSHKYGLFFLLIRFTGIRKEEASAIEIKDIDLKNNTILIDKAISFVNNQGKLKSTKNKKSRQVYILDIFRELLIERIKYCKENNIKYLFTKQTNEKERVSDSSITTMCSSFLLYINKINKQSNPKAPDIKFTLHQLRHSFCTMCYYSDVGIKEAQELMGHSSADMVYDVYTHLDMSKGKPFDKLNNYTSKTF